jgi:uncharacterized RDD family membrane protein YckC
MGEKSATSTYLKKASFWKRLIACLIDNLMIMLVVEITAVIFQFPNVVGNIGAFILFYLYGTFSEHYFQTTAGKSVMKLKVVGEDRQAPTLLNSFFRNLGKMISAIPLFYGFLRILAPHQQQTMHDELGKCWVIDLRI